MTSTCLSGSPCSMTLSNVLKGVISQRLVPTVDGKRSAALEVMVSTPRIKTLIMENRDSEIRDTIEEGKEIYGSQSFDQAILDLYTKGTISKEAAFENATSASDLKLKMEGVNMVKRSIGDKNKKQEDFQDEDIFELKT